MLVGEFLIERLRNAGVEHAFGIPGDYILDFYSTLWDSKEIEVINTTDEAHAGFAADSYARVKGVGCVVVTYNVGASKVINAVQCAYAERSPLIVISGAPGMKEREDGVLLHHMVSSFNSQRDMFSKITCASVVLDNPNTAGYLIDSALEALQHYKRPVYIELPRDVVKKSISYDVYKQGTPKSPQTDKYSLIEAVGEVKDWLLRGKQPVILAGVELARFNMGKALLKFAERNNIKIATTLLSKSVVNERHSLFSGIYAGGASKPEVRELVEGADPLVMLGVMLTDMTLCFRPSKFEKREMVSAGIDGFQISSHEYANIQFVDFCEELFKLDLKVPNAVACEITGCKQKFEAQKDQPITTPRLFEKINSVLDEKMAIVCDIGDALFGAADVTVHSCNHFLSPAFYTSMGVAVPGALGVQVAKPDVRPIVIVGDGAAQMSICELSTIVRRRLNPIVFVLNNKGYLTERFIKDGEFNNIPDWKFEHFPEIFGGGQGFSVSTEEELDVVVDKALDSKELVLVNVHVSRDAVSPSLRRIAQSLSEKI